jgi:hypothetical protein
VELGSPEAGVAAFCGRRINEGKRPKSVQYMELITTASYVDYYIVNSFVERGTYRKSDN